MSSISAFTRRPRESSLGRLLCVINRRYSMLVLRRMAGLGIGQGQVLLMAELYHRHAAGEPPFSQDALAGVLKVDKGTVARALAPLEQAGYITRSPDANDRRVKRVLLTAQALAVEAEFYTILYETSDALLEGIPHDAQAALLGTLHTVLGNAEALLAESCPPAEGDDA